MKTTEENDTPSNGRWRRRLLAAPIVTAALAAMLAWGGPAEAQTPAHIRLAHFSPDTPEMDVYVAPADGDESKVLDGLGYGEVSDYAELEPGSYSFLLRPMGAPADSAPAVTASAELEDGTAYTFAAMGPHADLAQALLTDDLAPPPAGQAKVRLIQASSSAGEVDVTTVDGPVLAQDRAFATATEYAPVAAGQWTVEVTTSSGDDLQRRLDLDAGTINTLVVLEGDGGGPELTRVVDATGVDISSGGPLGATQAVPLGGVGTGGGGTADDVIGVDVDPVDASSSSGGTMPLVVVGLGVTLVTALILGGSRLMGNRSG